MNFILATWLYRDYLKHHSLMGEGYIVGLLYFFFKRQRILRVNSPYSIGAIFKVDFSTAMRPCPLMHGNRMESVNPCPHQDRIQD
ncbi:hypothetical protein HanIR_Chr11g0556261 [Helianthus annuus]|nr:hypothetical protein HanIR_Chr11g0556261 [Helianthus annuus]